jgi:hypothetical protein
LVFFVGAGLSTLSEYPQWWELVDKYYYELYGKRKGRNYTSDDYLKIPQIFYDVKGETAYDAILEDVFSIVKTPNSIHYKLVAMNPVHIITTNYDDLIEKTCWQRGKYYSLISAEEDVANASSSRYLLKAHGDFNRGFKGKNIVLKESDYINYDLSFPLISNLMKTLMATHTIVFIGYGLNDYNINILLNWVKNLQKDGYNKPFFIRTDHDPIEKNTATYYEKKGLRIIDSARLLDTEERDYMARYNSILDLLIESRDNDDLSSDDDVIGYIYQKLSPLFVLQSVRKLDLKDVFDYDYHFEVNGTVIRNKNRGFGYMEHFFEIKEKGTKDLSSETKKKFEEISNFFDSNKVLCMHDKLGEKKIVSTYTINSPAFHNDYEEMERVIQIVTDKIDQNYEKAFYLACLGRWEESYNLYSELISKGVEKSNWWIHYLSQINRYRLYQSIIQSTKYYSGVGMVVYRRHYKPFSDGFVDRIENELKSFDINDVFQSMPYEFQDKFKILEFLSDNQFLYEDTVKLFELTNKVRAEINKGTYSVGSLTSDINVQFRLNDNVRFLYDNSLWSVNFTEIKQYIRNSLTMQFEKAEYDQTRDNDELGFFMGAGRSNFWIDYYDFVNITKSFGIEDVKYIERSCSIEKLSFSDVNEIENYINRIADNLIKHFSSGGMNIIFYNIFIFEAKTAFYFAKYIKLSKDSIVKLFKTILFYFPEFDADIGKRYLWLDRIISNNGLPESVIPIIEEFLLKQADKHKNIDFSEQSTNGLYSRNFANLIQYCYKDFTSKELSEYAVKLTSETKNQIDYMYRLAPILSKEAKKHLFGMKKITGINDLMDGLRAEDVDDISEYEDIILDFLEKRLSTINEDREKGKIVSYTNNYIIEFGIKYFFGEIKNDKMKSFVGVDEEYDLFIDPESYDFKKFKPVWLKKYSDELLDRMSENECMSSNIVKILKERVENSNDKKYIDILIKHFI